MSKIEITWYKGELQKHTDITVDDLPKLQEYINTSNEIITRVVGDLEKAGIQLPEGLYMEKVLDFICHGVKDNVTTYSVIYITFNQHCATLKRLKFTNKEGDIELIPLLHAIIRIANVV